MPLRYCGGDQKSSCHKQGKHTTFGQNGKRKRDAKRQARPRGGAKGAKDQGQTGLQRGTKKQNDFQQRGIIHDKSEPESSTFATETAGAGLPHEAPKLNGEKRKSGRKKPLTKKGDFFWCLCWFCGQEIQHPKFLKMGNNPKKRTFAKCPVGGSPLSSQEPVGLRAQFTTRET